MCEGSDRTAESLKLLDLSFLDSATGPLWRARALPESREKACVAPGLKDAFPYEPTYIMSYHHGVIDGTSAFVIVMTLLELVEAELGGCPVDEAQVGRIAGDEQTQPLDRDMRARLEKEPERLRSLINQRLEKSFAPLITESFETPQVDVPETITLENDLESSTLIKFGELYRNAGVTFNAGTTAAINVASVELVRGAGLARDNYQITGRHAVNLRRYWKQEPAHAFGCHTGGMLLTSDAPGLSRRTFWQRAPGRNCARCSVARPRRRKSQRT